MFIWPMLIIGIFMVVQMAVMLIEAIRWQQRQITENRTITFTDYATRSPLFSAFSGMAAIAYGLAGLIQLTKGFAIWPTTSSESAGALLGCCYIAAGGLGSYFAYRRAQRLARTGEPIQDERDRMITVYALRSACVVLFFVLIVRGMVHTIPSPYAVTEGPFGIILQHFMTDPYLQTAMMGAVAFLLFTAYYRHRMN